MIGVIANPAEKSAVCEFFELFKTPWEFYRADRQYEVVLCACDAKLDGIAPRLLLVYSSEKTSFDGEQKIRLHSRLQGPALSHAGSQFPIYGNCVTFRHQGTSTLTEGSSRESVAHVDRCGENVFARVGYDLFREVQALLTKGQPPANAGIPTLELHIAFLRDLINGCGVPVVEIPPVPDGYPFIACLTHDVDHPSIRWHKFDRTMFGFLYRAILGSVANVSRGRLRLRGLFTNWAAAAKLPLIYLGLSRDFWYEFDRYLAIEKAHRSTFFVIPFKDDPGRSSQGRAPGARASGYGASDIAEKIRQLKSAGCEIGLHGIDAWLDSSRGLEERRQISAISETPDMGVRMHWLYMNEESPAVLENAGFSYDSTVGYSETVGYRAGTGQVFKPLRAARLLELPLHVMDTALFYPQRLNLSPEEAWQRVSPLLNNAVRMGGALTINWHDRSIAPERLWDEFYVRLLDALESRGAWFTTAAQAVSWFRKRRSAIFETIHRDPDGVRVKISAPAGDGLPGLRLRIHKARGAEKAGDFEAKGVNAPVDIGLNGSIDICIPL